MALRFLLDSVILIDHFNGITAATTYLVNHSADCALSVITRAEVLTGFEAPQETIALQFVTYSRRRPLRRYDAGFSSGLPQIRVLS